MLTPDPQLIARLPLPLARTYNRAFRQATPAEGLMRTMHLGEVTLKYVTALGVAAWRGAGRPDPEGKLRAALKKMVRPALGHWLALLEHARKAFADGTQAFLLPELADLGTETI